MNSESIKAALEKLPLTVMLVFYLVYLGWDYNAFTTDPTSTLNMKKGQVVAAKDELAKLTKRMKEVQAFLKGLESKRQELRRLAQELEDTKTVLTDSIDVPSFMKQVLTEAKMVGLSVKGLTPGEMTKHEYYSQQAFDMQIRGAYVQVIGFFERLANLRKIVRVDNFKIRPISKPSAKYVELQGTVELKAFRYLGSKADELAKKGPATLPVGGAAKKGAGT